MTEDEFFARLRETPRDWWVGLYGTIRRTHEGHPFQCQCPISALVDDVALHARAAADRLGLDAIFTIRVIRAADLAVTADKTLRRKLLDATGLRELHE